MGARRRWKRTDLFLVRVWHDVGPEFDRGPGDETERAAGVPGDESRTDLHAGRAWRGQVRRVSSGESLQFESLDALLNVLIAMLGESDDGRK